VRPPRRALAEGRPGAAPGKHNLHLRFADEFNELAVAFLTE
jgi:hypothetical protein